MVKRTDRIVACMSEAGYPPAFTEPVPGHPGRERAFWKPLPPFDVFAKACELCGIADLDPWPPETTRLVLPMGQDHVNMRPLWRTAASDPGEQP